MLQNTSSPTYAKDQAKAKTGDIDKVMLGTLGLGLAPIAAQAAPAALAPGGAFWSSPITQGIAASSLGAQAVNTASNAVMHKDWSTAMSDAIQNSTGYRPSEYLTEFTNPGAWLDMGGAKLNISGNPIQQIKDIYNLGKAASNYTGKYVQNKINLNKVGNKLMQNIDNTTLPNEFINDASKQYSTESKDILDDTISNIPNYSGSDGKFNTNYTQAPKLSRPITDRQVQAFNGDFNLTDNNGNLNMRALVRLNKKLKDNGIFYKKQFNKDDIVDDFKKAYEMSKQFPIPDDSTRKQFVQASVLGSLFGENKYNARNIALPKIDFKDDFKEIFKNEFNDNVIEAAFQQDGDGIINKSPLERAVYLTRHADNDYNNTIFKYPYLHYPSKDGVKPLIVSDNILKDKGINFRILSDKFYNDKGLSVQNYKSRKALAEDIDYVNKLVDDLHFVDPFTKKTVRLENYNDPRFIGILNQFITSKDNSVRKFGYMIRDAVLKKDFDKYEQLISSKKMFDSIINEKLGTLKTTYKVSDKFKRLKNDPSVLKQIMDQYGAIPRYQMDGFGEHDLFLNNGKTSAKSNIASEGYLLGKRGQKVVDVEDVQHIHKGVSRKQIQQRNNGNIDRQDQTENLSMKNLRNVILPVLGLGALKKKNKK